MRCVGEGETLKGIASLFQVCVHQLLPCSLPVQFDLSELPLPVCDDCLTGKGAGLCQGYFLLHSSLTGP